MPFRLGDDSNFDIVGENDIVGVLLVFKGCVRDTNFATFKDFEEVEVGLQRLVRKLFSVHNVVVVDKLAGSNLHFSSTLRFNDE